MVFDHASMISTYYVYSPNADSNQIYDRSKLLELSARMRWKLTKKRIVELLDTSGNNQMTAIVTKRKQIRHRDWLESIQDTDYS